MSDLCVYGLSPTYSTLPRLNTLILLIFVLYGPADNWATKGALAALMLRVSVVSLHAIALLAVLLHQEHISASPHIGVDLDIFGAWALLGAVGTAMPALLGWAPALISGKARPLVRVWGIAAIVGAACAYAAIVRVKRLGFTTEDAGGNVQFCSSLNSFPMRGNSVALAFPWKTIFSAPREKVMKAWDVASLVMMAFGAWSCLRLGRVGQFVITASRMDALNPTESTQEPQDAAFWVILEKSLMTASVVFFWGFVVLWELFFFDQALPELEGIRSFEQWSCWAATGLVLLATVVNSALEDMPTAKGSIPQEQPWNSIESSFSSSEDPHLKV